MRTVEKERRRAALAPTPNMYGIRFRKFFKRSYLHQRREVWARIEALHDTLQNSRGSQAMHRARREAAKAAA